MQQELTKQNSNNNMERARESAVWTYFTLNTATSSTAVCDVCKANVAGGGRGSTANYNSVANELIM